MAGIILAAVPQSGQERLSRMVLSCGHTVFRRCGSDGELRRTINEYEDGIVVFLGLLPDCGPDELKEDFGDRIEILLIGSAAALASCGHPGVYKLPLTASRWEISGALEILSRRHSAHLPKRSPAQRQIVERAKEKLMKEWGITEPEAHRLIQRYAMDRSLKMTEAAERVLSGRFGKKE